MSGTHLHAMLEAVWRASWQGGIFLLAIWGACSLVPRVTRRVIPAEVRCWLWWIAIVQLPVRVLLTIPIAISFLPSQTVTTSVDAVEPSFAAPAQRETSYTRQFPLTSNIRLRGLETTSLPGVTPAKRIDVEQTLCLAYLLGISFCFCRQAVRLRRTASLIRTAEPIEDARANRILREVIGAFGQTPAKTLGFLEAATAPCPLLAGLLKPKIVLPRETWKDLSDAELRMTLAHEFAHLSRRDLWREVPASIVRSLFFFHPLLWLAAREMASACEESCDTQALLVTGGSRVVYAKLLIRSAQGGFKVVAMGSTLGYVLLHRRLEMLKRNSELVTFSRSRWAIAAVLATVAASPFTLAQAQTSTNVPASNNPQHNATHTSSAKASKAKKHHVSKAMTAKSITVAWHATNSQPQAPKSSVIPDRNEGGPELTDSNTATRVGKDTDGPLMSAHFNGQPLRQTLIQLLDAAGVNYSLKSGIKPDFVTCSVKSMPLNATLQLIFRSIHQPLTYSIAGGTYLISAREDEQSVAPITVTPQPVPKIEVSPAELRGGPTDMGQIIPSLVAQGADVRELLRVLLTTRSGYSIDPEVQGTVTVSLKNVTLASTLANILRQVDATYTLKDGIIVIVRH